MSRLLESYEIVRRALREHTDGHTITGRVVLFSGGNDSTTLTHMMINAPADIRATHAGHANTTIGIEETRQFVRDRCAGWNLPLIEHVAPTSYRDLVLDQGFPGPAMHFKMYQRLKERNLEAIRRELVRNPRQERVLFIAGRRRIESARRSGISESERRGSTIWVSPLVDWSNEDLAGYRREHRLPRNPVAEKLGMSGECLCGAFAEPGEYDRIAEHYPHVAQEISDLQADALGKGLAPQKCKWGWGAYREDPEGQTAQSGPLCSSCDARYESRPWLKSTGRVRVVRRRAREAA